MHAAPEFRDINSIPPGGYGNASHETSSPDHGHPSALT